MPNHVKNIITISGDKNEFYKLSENVKGNDPYYGYEISFDFEKIIPMPDNIYQGDLKIGESYDENNWLDWSIDHWGTKWNAYEHEERENGFVSLTAWSAPHPVIEKLAKDYPKLTIRHRWADEDIGNNCGTRVYKSGELVSEDKYDGKANNWQIIPRFVSFARRVWKY